jgi:hypothetical protein
MRHKSVSLLTCFLLILPVFFLSSQDIAAQGNIYGLVINSDISVPDSGDISFFGYLDDTDEEIRLESSTGACYDVGNWYDDFQNYLTEGPGNPYDYHFYNSSLGEGYVLSGLIPNNSFQQEDVSLAPVDWPVIQSGFTGEATTPYQVILYWPDRPDLTCHVYRREASSDGSFFRIDDPSGSLANVGIADSFYIDNDVDSTGAYDYLIIPENLSGTLGPHSNIVTIDIFNTFFIVADANRDGLINIGDAVFIINYAFRDGPPPVPYEAADANCDGLVNIGDAVNILNYIFREGPRPDCP